MPDRETLRQQMKAEFYATNKHFRRKKQHKVVLPGFHSTVAYSKGRFQVFSNTLPLNWLPNNALVEQIAKKRIQWNPFLRQQFISKGRFIKLSFQDFPFVVIDFDENTCDDVRGRLFLSDFSLNNTQFSLSPSLSGRGCHLHVWADFSNLPRDKYASGEEECLTKWQDGIRFQTYKSVQLRLIDEIEKKTGLRADRSAAGSHLAYSPEEIGHINEFWTGKEPVKVLSLFSGSSPSPSSITNKSLEKKLQPFFEEMEAFLLDCPYEEVAKWVEDHCEMTTVDENYYRSAMIYLRNNFSTIKEYILENWEKASLFSVKKQDVAVGVEDIQSRFFGLHNTKFLTYIRRVFLYMFCLSKTRDAVYKRLVAQFCYTPESEAKSYFKSSFLEKFWFSKKVDLSKAREQISRDLGNGQTFERLKYWTPLVVTAFGLMEGLSILYDGLDLSCANDKTQRKKEIYKFAHKVEQRRSP